MKASGVENKGVKTLTTRGQRHVLEEQGSKFLFELLASWIQTLGRPFNSKALQVKVPLAQNGRSIDGTVTDIRVDHTSLACRIIPGYGYIVPLP